MAEKTKENNDSVKSMCDAMTTMADSLSKFGNMSDALDRMESQISGLAGAIKESRESGYEVSAEEQSAKIAAESSKDEVVAVVEEKTAPAQDAMALALDKMTALVEKLATRPEVTADGYVPTYVGNAKKSPVTKNPGGGFDIAL
jgi:methyl-accepting chemotaxis protein